MAAKNAARVADPPGTAGFQPARACRLEAGGPRSAVGEAAVLLAAYLYGSLPVVYLLGAQRDVDLRRRGSGNVGGSNLWAAAGAVRGLTGWVGDASKGLVPILVARRLGCR